MTLAGKYVKDESINNLIHLIAATPELYTYCVHKLYYSISENIDQDGLVKVGLWCIGEYGLDLINGKAKGPDGAPIVLKETEVVDLIERAMNRINVPESIKEFALNCLIKLYPNFKSAREKIRAIIDSQTTSAYLEVQQRACEYIQLLESDWDQIRSAIVEKMPLCTSAAKAFGEKPVGDKEIDELPPQLIGSKGGQAPGLLTTNVVDVRKETAVQDLLDLDEEPEQNDNKSGTTTTSAGSNPSTGLYDLDFGGGGSKPSTVTIVIRFSIFMC